MKQRATTAAPARGNAIWDKLREFLRGQSRTFEQLGYALAGFLAANCAVFGGIAPFGVAFVAAGSAAQAGSTATSSGKGHGAAAACGAVVGYLVGSGAQGGLKYIAMLIMVFCVRSALSLAKRFRENAVAVPLGAAASALAVEILFLSLYGADAYSVALALAEILLIGGTAYFFHRAMQGGMLGLSAANTQERACIAIAFAVLLMGMAPLNISGFSVGRFLGAAVVLLMAYHGREAGGAVAGVAAGTALTLAPGGMPFLAAGFGLGGLVAGIFAVFGKIGSALAFLAINAVTVLASESAADSGTVLFVLIETAAASMLFLLIPNSVGKRLSLFKDADAMRSEPHTVRAVAIGRLSHSSRALKSIADTTKSAEQKIASLNGNENITSVYTAAIDRVCAACPKNASCWQSHYSDRMSLFNDLGPRLRQAGRIERESFPRYFHELCGRSARLVEEINLNYLEYTLRGSARHRISGMRTAVIEQFDGMSVMLRRLSDELSEIADVDRKNSMRARELLEDRMLAPQSAVCYQDSGGRMTVEVELPEYKLARVDPTELALDLSDITGRELTVPSVGAEDGTARMQFRERANFAVTSHRVQYAAHGERFCGDNCSVLEDSSGMLYVMLSDGMGSGREAALSSSMASGLMTRLIEGGFGFDAALRMVNAALLVKTGEESLATIDGLALDLFTGRADFYKAGAAPSFLRRGSKTMKIESMSVPAGILGGVEFEKNTMTAKPGDLILLVSDGVTMTGEDWIPTELEIRDGEDCAAAAQRIADMAKGRLEGGREDDITVILLQVNET